MAQVAPVSLVIVDQRMPGMSGVDLVQRIRQRWPDVLCMVLTGYADLDVAMDAVNKGSVYRFFMKPWEDAELRSEVRQALEHFDLVQENRSLTERLRQRNSQLQALNANLERQVQERTEDVQRRSVILAELYRELEATYMDTVRILTDLLELHEPEMAGHARRVSEGAAALAERLNLDPEERRDTEIAAALHDIGKIGIPGAVLLREGRTMTNEDMAIYKQYPVLGEMTVQSVRRLRGVATLVRGHRERFNGTGFPDTLAGESIPLGARIIAVVDCFDETKDRAILEAGRGNRFDPKIVDLYGEHLEQQARLARPQVERRIRVSELQEQMVLTRDLYTRRGLLLAPKGKVLDGATIAKITSFHKVDSLVEPINVKG
jgi:response regulator RpfG family c-di-GMP phosphodiesterase